MEDKFFGNDENALTLDELDGVAGGRFTGDVVEREKKEDDKLTGMSGGLVREESPFFD